MHLQRAHDGEVALVRQGRNDQPERVPQVLVTVLPLAGHHHHLVTRERAVVSQTVRGVFFQGTNLCNGSYYLRFLRVSGGVS